MRKSHVESRSKRYKPRQYVSDREITPKKIRIRSSGIKIKIIRRKP